MQADVMIDEATLQILWLWCLHFRDRIILQDILLQNSRCTTRYMLHFDATFHTFSLLASVQVAQLLLQSLLEAPAFTSLNHGSHGIPSNYDLAVRSDSVFQRGHVLEQSTRIKQQAS